MNALIADPDDNLTPLPVGSGPIDALFASWRKAAEEDGARFLETIPVDLPADFPMSREEAARLVARLLASLADTVDHFRAAGVPVPVIALALAQGVAAIPFPATIENIREEVDRFVAELEAAPTAAEPDYSAASSGAGE